MLIPIRPVNIAHSIVGGHSGPLTAAAIRDHAIDWHCTLYPGNFPSFAADGSDPGYYTEEDRIEEIADQIVEQQALIGQRPTGIMYDREGSWLGDIHDADSSALDEWSRMHGHVKAALIEIGYGSAVPVFLYNAPRRWAAGDFNNPAKHAQNRACAAALAPTSDLVLCSAYHYPQGGGVTEEQYGDWHADSCEVSPNYRTCMALTESSTTGAFPYLNESQVKGLCRGYVSGGATDIQIWGNKLSSYTQGGGKVTGAGTAPELAALDAQWANCIRWMSEAVGWSFIRTGG